MFELIEKLRKKPERVKKQIAFLIAFTLSGIIFIIWLSVIYPDWKNGQNGEIKVANNEPSPWSGFADNFSAGISDIKNQFSSIKNSITSLSNAPAHYSATDTVATTTNLIK